MENLDGRGGGGSGVFGSGCARASAIIVKYTGAEAVDVKRGVELSERGGHDDSDGLSVERRVGEHVSLVADRYDRHTGK